MNLSKYVYITDSIDEKSKLLYNSKNDYFIKYNKNDFGELDDFLSNNQIFDFLEEHSFFSSEDEEQKLKVYHDKALKSEDTLMLILKITKKCNFRCTYCYENFMDNNLIIKNQNILIKYIKNKLSEGKIHHLIISWFGGEPLMNIECILNMAAQLIDVCKSFNVKYSSSIVTNGFLLSSKVIDMLYKSGVNTFQITLDGAPFFMTNNAYQRMVKKHLILYIEIYKN